MLRSYRFASTAAPVLLAVALAACGSGGGGASPEDNRFASMESFQPSADAAPAPAGDSAAELGNRFVLEHLAQALGAQPPDAAVAGTPSLQALAVMAAGAEAGTAEDLFTALGAEEVAPALLREIGGLGRHGVQGGWLHTQTWGPLGYRFLRSYLEALTADFSAGLATWDPAAADPGFRAAMDSWAQGVSGGRVASLAPFSSAPERSRLGFAAVQVLDLAWPPVLAAAPVFQGLFEEADGEQFWLPMVAAEATWPAYEDDLVTAVDIPLDDGPYSLLAIQPKAGGLGGQVAGLPALVPQIVAGLSPKTGSWIVPLFSVPEQEVPLQAFLEARGLSRAFAEGEAEFEGINGLGYLYLEGVRARAGFGLTATGVRAVGAAAIALAATVEEPPEAWEPPPGGGGDHSVTFTSRGCFGGSIYTPAGLPDARPGFFLLRDRESGVILQAAALLSPGGEPAGQWECQDLFGVEVETHAVTISP